MWRAQFRITVPLVLVALMGIGGIMGTLPKPAAGLPSTKKESARPWALPGVPGAGEGVLTLKAEPTARDVSAALGITWWHFKLPKNIAAVEIGVREGDHFQRIERYDLSEKEAPGLLKVAYLDDGFGEYKLVILTSEGKLQIPRNKKPADFVRTHDEAVVKGEFLELLHFKASGDKEWRHTLAIRVIEKR